MWAVRCGFALASVGLVVGVVMALKRREIRCPDGTFFPEGTTDFRCFAHPQALDGTAIAVFSVMLGIVIGLIGVIAKASVAGGAAADSR